MHLDITIPFWGSIAIIFVIGCVIAFIISLFADDGGYLGDFFNAILIALALVVTVCICMGMILGKYVF